MGRAAVIEGRSIQGDDPAWTPLEAALGLEVVGDFMWMFEVELDDGRRVQAYKHIDTRCYVHLDADCTRSCTRPRAATAASGSSTCSKVSSRGCRG